MLEPHIHQKDVCFSPQGSPLRWPPEGSPKVHRLCMICPPRLLPPIPHIYQKEMGVGEGPSYPHSPCPTMSWGLDRGSSPIPCQRVVLSWRGRPHSQAKICRSQTRRVGLHYLTSPQPGQLANQQELTGGSRVVRGIISFLPQGGSTFKLKTLRASN